jgi:hypothetical protein
VGLWLVRRGESRQARASGAAKRVGRARLRRCEVGIYNIPTLNYEKIHQSAGSSDSIRTATVRSHVLCSKLHRVTPTDRMRDGSRHPPGVSVNPLH